MAVGQIESPLCTAILERIDAEVDRSQADLISAFAKAYLHRLPPEAPVDQDLFCAQIADVVKFITDRPGPMAVRAFNPTVEDNGYTTSGTVIEINLDDSPFLLDSVIAEIHAHNLEVAYVIHPVIGTERDPDGRLTAIRHARHTTSRESIQHYQLNRTLFEGDLPGLERGVRAVVESVRRTVTDFHAMAGRLERMIDLCRITGGHFSETEIEEAIAFLHWLGQDNFVFLGYREYKMLDTTEGRAVVVVPRTGLGILSDETSSNVAAATPLDDFRPEVAARFEGGDLLVITKTNRLSPVHRRVRMDYVGVRMIGQDGRSVGEARMIGLFTSKAYMEPAARTPILRRKLATIVAGEDLIEGSHDHKAMIELFEGFSKHDLFAAPTEELRRNLLGLLALQERSQVKLFIRRDLLERSISILVALPRDRFNAVLRKRLQDLFRIRLGGAAIDYHLALGEADPAQIHFTVWIETGDMPEIDYERLEAEVIELTRSWGERLAAELTTANGHAEAQRLSETWAPRFPEYYTTYTSIQVAGADIGHLDRLTTQEQPFTVGIHNEPVTGESEPLTRIALYRSDGKRPLTELMPALENLGLEVVEEVPTRIKGAGGFFIHDFGVLGADGERLDPETTGDRIRSTLEAVWAGAEESDDLNRLVVVAGLRHDQVVILRAYRTYWRRVRSVFTVSYTNDTLVMQPEIVAKLVRLFELRFDPAQTGEGYIGLRDEVIAELDALPSLDADRILRGFLRLIDATVRTNAYVPARKALAFKLDSARVPDMPRPFPLTEIFVWDRGVEGIHLRGGRVARGGIRWSTRREDYRTEVLGLMKAQMTKNAVIVPTGAKGGFVVRRPTGNPAELPAEVERQYRVFIGSLLDLADNRVGGVVVHPDRVRYHDTDDTYLVVAADKGTATFSDVANQLAMERRFWLDDAFASGGSSGYDHKALGITARGAWKSLERLFAELGIDPARDEFTAVGIGDMSGDVFGNGMLASDRIKLVAAFDHRHVFLDPAPDPILSYAERRRLFDLPRSSWADYDQSLISTGGGVWPRTAKKLELSPEVQAALATDHTVLTPSELIALILKAPVDLFWNGGIGTYVKARTETHEQVGDRTNDAVRVDAADLRCRVVVEGGNLGLTQRGRIEYARQGGRVHADFIDNSGGVDCSDREVNLKILLGMAMERGEIDRSERDELIAEVVDEVVERILYDNFQQAQVLSQEEGASSRRIEAYEQLIATLEEEGLVNRVLDAVPSTEEMMERARTGQGMTRPELAVLLANSKRSLEDALAKSSLPDSDYLVGELGRYFPARVTDRFGHLLAEHPLRRQLLATIVANDVVNSEGVVFVTRLVAQTGAAPDEVVAAYRIARDLSRAVDRWEQIEDLFGKLELDLVSQMMRDVDRKVAALTRWYLTHRDPRGIGAVIAASQPGFDELVEGRFGPGDWVDQQAAVTTRLVEAGVSEVVARRHSAMPLLGYAPDAIQVAEQFGRSIVEVVDVFLRIGKALGLDRLTELTRTVDITSRWQRWAVWTVEEELLTLRRLAATRVLEEAPGLPSSEAVETYLGARAPMIARLHQFMETFESGPTGDPAALMVALSQVRAALN